MIGESGKPAHGLRIVITYPFPLGRANGGARMTREIARHLGKSGAEVIVLPVSASPDKRFSRPKVEDRFLGFEFDDDLSRDSVEVVRVPQHALHWRFDGREVRRSLAQIIKQRRVDAVLSYYHEAAFLPPFLHSRNVTFGYIATWQSYAKALPAARKNWVRRFVGARLDHEFIIKPHRQADIVFATSQFTRDELINVLGVDGKRIVVCHLGVGPGFTELDRPAPEQITRFLFFGRIIKSKGVLDAIQALGRLARKGIRNWEYRIFGSGEHQWARNAAREQGIGELVVVSDPVDDSGLRRELSQAHLAIMPSHFEAFGLSIAEAQAAGIPVVAYNAGSVPEIVENGVTGWLAPVGDVDALARSIEQAVQNPAITHRAGLAGRTRVTAKFAWQHTAATIIDGLRGLERRESGNH